MSDLRNIEVQPPEKLPSEVGNYIVWLPFRAVPLVLPWTSYEQCWRWGACRVTIAGWAGPLPVVKP